MEAMNQIIVVEDNAADYELITHALRRAGCHFQSRRVNSQRELDAELLRLSPDVVLCDHAGARWNSFSILQQVRAFEPAMPFIVVTGAVDARTQDALRGSGVDDCISKNRLDELAPAVKRVLLQHDQVRRLRVDEIRRTGLPFPPEQAKAF
jgi:CheY-like chemotaxis protein